MRDVGWAAGVFEGEGCLHVRKQGPGDTAFLILRMTDEDVVRAVAGILGVGNMYGPYYPCRSERGAERKPYWTWAVNRPLDVVHVIDSFMPYLGARRVEEASRLRRVAMEVVKRSRNYRLLGGTHGQLSYIKE